MGGLLLRLGSRVGLVSTARRANATVRRGSTALRGLAVVGRQNLDVHGTNKIKDGTVLY